MLFLALREADIELRAAVLPVQVEWHDRVAATLDGADGPVRLKLVKPCVRCPVPDIDPATAEGGHAVGDALAGYRADARVGGAITFGMNAVIVEGFERMLRVGQNGSASYRFD